MRHRRSGRKLNRNASHRAALLRNMAVSLIVRSAEGEGAGGIVTTIHKAKYLRPFVERLVTLSKRTLSSLSQVPQKPTRSQLGQGGVSSGEWQAWCRQVAPAVAMRRRMHAALRSKQAVEVLLRDIAPRYVARNGGYLRIVRLAKGRVGDSGVRSLIGFVGRDDRRS